jgi:hypothetical protein
MLAGCDDEHGPPQAFADGPQIALREIAVPAPLDEPEYVGEQEDDRDGRDEELSDGLPRNRPKGVRKRLSSCARTMTRNPESK